MMARERLGEVSRMQWTLFLLSSGAASTAAEIVGLRLLAPLFGSSLFVWGTAIAVVLAGLALGYALGGRFSRWEASPKLVMNIGALGAAVFLWMPLAMAVARSWRDAFLASGSVAAGAGSLLLAWLVLLPPSILFGMVSPLAVQAEFGLTERAAGSVAGRISMLTTVGSLLGILLPSFFTVPFLGSLQTVWLFAGVVLVLSSPAWAVTWWRLLIPVVVAFGATWWVVQPEEHALLVEESPYQYIVVREAVAGTRELLFEAGFGIQSVYSADLYAGGYWDAGATLPVVLGADVTEPRVLVLGAAASAVERQMTRFWPGTDFSFTSVEIDPTVIEVAERYFDPPPRRVVAADARSFVIGDDGTYDLVLLDTYSRELTVPWHMATREFFAALKPRVAESGVVALNLNATSLDTLWVKSMARTVETSFAHVAAYPIADSCNILLLGSDAPLRRRPLAQVPAAVRPLWHNWDAARVVVDGGVVLTDNRAPTDFLGLLALLTGPDGATCG